MTKNYNLLQREIFEMQMEAIDLYRSGKSKQEIVRIFELRGVPRDTAEIIADSGTAGIAAQESLQRQEEEESFAEFQRMVREVAHRIDNGRSREQILQWLLGLDMPLTLANALLEAGHDNYRIVIEQRKQKEYLNAYLVMIAGLAMAIWSYCEDYRLPYVFAACLVMFGIGMCRDANETALANLARVMR